MSFTASIGLSLNIGNTVSGFQQVTNAINQAQQAAAQGASGFTNVSNAARTAGSSVSTAGSGFTAFGGAIRTATTSQQGFTSGLGQVNSAASSSQGALRGMESALGNSATTTNNANSAVKFYSTSLTSSGTASAAAGTKFNAMGQAISTNVDAAQKTSTSFGSLNNVMGQTSQATEQTAQSTQRMGVNFGNAVGFMGAAVGSGVQLFETFESLERAQIGVDRASNMLSTSQIKETSLQNQLNKLVADGKTGTAEYNLVEEKLALQHDKTTTAADRLQLKQNDLAVTYADFAKNIIPEVVSVGGTMIGALANMGVNTSGLKDKFMSLIPALTGGATGMKGFGAALSAVALNPFTIALAVLAAALIAYKTNAFGFRDATDAVGKSVGDVNPVFRLMGDALKATGMMFGIVSGNADQMSADLHKDVTDVGNSWNVFLVILQRGVDVAAEMISNFFSPITGAFSQLASALDPAAQAIEQFFSTISSSLDPAASAIEAALNQIGVAISNFFTQALKARDEVDKWLDDNIVQPIIKGIQAIPGKLTSAAVDLVAVVWTALKAAGKAITDAAQWVDQMIMTPIANAINTIASIASRINKVDIVAIVWNTLKAIGKPITDALAWLATNIFNPIVEAINSGLKTIGGGVGKIDLVKVIWEIIKASSKPITDAGDWINKNLIEPITKALEGAQKAFQGGIAGLEEWGKQNDLSKQKVDAHSGSIIKQSASYNEYGGKVQFVSDTLDEANGIQGEANEGMIRGVQSADNLSAAQTKVASTITQNLAAVAGLSSKYKESIQFETVFTDKLTEQDLAGNRTLAVYNEMGAELRKLQDTNKTAGIEVSALSNLMKESTFVQELQTKGVNEQAKALLTTEQETAVMQGKLQELNSELSSGEAQWVSYSNGVAKADLEFAQNEQKLAASQGELESLNTHLTDGTATWQAYRQGITDADLEYDKFITSSVQAGAKQLELNNLLRDAAASFGGLPGFIEPTIANLEAFVKAGMSLTGTLRDNGEAFKEFETIAQSSFDKMTAAGQEFFNKLVEASGKGGTDAADAFAKAWDELPNAVKGTLDETDKVALESAAQFAQAGKQAGEAYSLKLMAGIAEGKPWDQAVKDARDAAMSIVDQVGALSPDMQAKATELFSKLSTAAASEIPKILAEAQKIPGPIGEIAAKMAETFKTQGMDKLAPAAQAGFGAIPTTAKSPVDQSNATLNTIADTFIQVMTAIEQAIQRMPVFFAENFATAATNATNALALIGTNAQTMLTNIQTLATTLVAALTPIWTQIATEGTNAFLLLQTNIAAFVASVPPGIQTMVAAITPMWTQIADEGTNAFLLLQSNIDSFVQSVISGIQGIVGPISAAFARATSDATGYLNTMLKTAQNTFAAIGTASNAIVGPISSAFAKAQAAATQSFNKIAADAKTAFAAVSSAADSAASRVSSAMSKIVSSANQARSAVQQVASAIDALHDKTVTITVVTRYVTQGSPSGYQHGGILSEMPARGPFVTDRRQRYRGHIIGESGKPELVLPLSKNAADLADKSVNLKTLLKKLKGGKDKESDDSKSTKVAFITPPPAAPGVREGGGGGGGRSISVKGKFTNDIPIQVNVDGKKFMTMVQRQLLEFSDSMV